MIVFDAATGRGQRRSTDSDPSLALRLKVRAARGRLDRQIAAGRRCEEAATLSLRARRLTAPATQHQIARNLRRIVKHVDRRGSRKPISTVVIDPAAVRAGRRAILELAEQLERAASVNPRGVVLARALLTDGLGPLFNRYCERTVIEAVAEISEALHLGPAFALSDGPPLG